MYQCTKMHCPDKYSESRHEKPHEYDIQDIVAYWKNKYFGHLDLLVRG